MFSSHESMGHHGTILQALAAEKAAVETNPEEIELDMDEAIAWVFCKGCIMVRLDDSRWM